MKLQIRNEALTLDLQIPAALYLEARDALRGADEGVVERIGLALLAIGHPVYSAGGLAIYADRRSLRDMAGAALDWLAVVPLGSAPAPVPVLLIWARLIAAEVRSPRIHEAPAAEPVPEPPPVYRPPSYRRREATGEE